MKKHFKLIAKQALIFLVIFSLVCWDLSLPMTDFIQRASAAGGVNIMYTFETGMPNNVFLASAAVPESIMKITAYETQAGTNRLNNITVQIDQAMNCMNGTCSASPFAITDLGSISIASTSGISLWLDDGDGTFEFDESQDTFISSTTATGASAWTTVADPTPPPDNPTNTLWQTTFSNLNLTIPTSYNAPLTIFAVVRAENNIGANPMHMFEPRIPAGGIDVAPASGATISDFPSGNSFYMPWVALGTKGGGDFMSMSAPVVISEIKTAAVGNVNNEFIELYNRTDANFDLSNFNIAYTASTTSSLAAWTASTTLTGVIPARGFYLIGKNGGYAGATSTNKTYSNFSMDEVGGYVGLVNPMGMAMDMVGYGSLTTPSLAEGGSPASAPQANGSIERKAYPSSSPSTMIGGVHLTKGNGSDSNNNSADFIIRSAINLSDPQNIAAPTETDMISAANRDVVINEFLYNTATSTSWIELYNASSTAININAWKLNAATSTTQIYTIPNFSLYANSFAIIHWNQIGTNATSSDGIINLYTGNMAGLSAVGGDLTLKNASNAIIDYMQFGGSGKAGEAAAAAAGKWTAGAFKPNSNYNESIARMGTSGDDYNMPEDFMYMSTPTPGFPNMGGDSTAPAAVTNVVLTDADSVNYGLTGNDVRITWAPSSINDPSFDRYEIYVLPVGTSLNTSQHNKYTSIYGQFQYISGAAQTTYTFTGSNDFAQKQDSANNALLDGNYQAYVVAVDFAGNKSSAIGSNASLLTSDAGAADTNPPMIDHMPVWQARVNQNLTFYARIGDDRDQCNLATSTLEYRVNTVAWGNATTTCAAPAMSGNTCIKQCVIPWGAGWNDTTSISYYLRAKDAANNSKYVGMFPTNSEAEAKNNAVTIDFIAAASWDDAGTDADLTGYVYNSSGSPIQDAFIIIDGVSTTTATTTSAGFFAIPDNAMPSGFQFVRVIKDGYMEMNKDTMRGTNNFNFYLSSGYMNTGSGGSSGSNGIRWTAPMDGMMMAPTNIACSGDCSTVSAGQMPIVISFFNQMDSSTIDDTDASNAGSNIYATADGNTKIAGSVKYAYNAGNNTSEARFYSGTALSAGTFYTIVVTPNVKDTNGNPIQSNRPSGNYEFSFTTMQDNSNMWGGGGNDFSNFGNGGMMMPPYVKGTNPTPGQFNVPRNAVLTMEFSEPMDSANITDIYQGIGIALYKITNESQWSSELVMDKNINVSLDNATKKIVTITHDALDSNSTNNGWYELRLDGRVKSQLGVWMGNPSNCGNETLNNCLGVQTVYTSRFQVGSSLDTTAPTIGGNYPANNDGITDTDYVDVAASAFEIGFSEAMNPNTVNSQSITLTKGTVSVSTNVKYDPMSNSAKITPISALMANSVYTLTASTSLTDLSGNKLNIGSGNNIISFKTGSADTAQPQVLYANGDDYQITVSFSEPMNAASKTDTDNWAYSVLNPANYYINTLGADTGCANPGSWSCLPALKAPYNTVGGNQASTLNNIQLSYDAETQTVTLKGFGMCAGQDYAQCTAIDGIKYFQVFVDNVKDRSNNAIYDTGNRAASATHRNSSRNPIQNSATTYGMLGPGSSIMMSDAGPGGPGAGHGMGMGPSMDMGKMGMFSAGVMPMNAMAGQTSLYFIDLPVTKALQDGMQVILTFPTGFDVAAVEKDPYSPMNIDMNNKNGGTVTFDTTYGVAGIASTTQKVITVKLDIATTSSNMINTAIGPDGFYDSLHIDLKGIKNSSIPKDFGTSGYTVDIKTTTSDGAPLESITTMPFFIAQGGSNSMTVVVNCGNVAQNSGTMSIFLGSPMTGPMEAVTTVFENGIATSTFSGIPSGQFMIFTDPYVTVGANTYLGKTMPEPVQVNGNTSKNITIEKEGAGNNKVAVKAVLIGNFSTSGNADNVDIFANSPSGFRVKTLTSVGNVNYATSTLYLTEGEWTMGVGPAVPKGPMTGPAPMPDWMQPPMVNVTVGIETINGIILDADADAINAATNNQEPISLYASSTKYFQVGDTIGFSSAAATSTITAITNDWTITVTPSANWGALPAKNVIASSTRESSANSNDGNINFNISTQSLKYIYGFVLDDSGNGVSNAEVYAYQPQGTSGGGHTTTDTSGKFSLKIGSNGVWTVGAFKQGMPNAKESTVEVKANSVGGDGNTTADNYLNGTIISDASNNNAGTNPLRLKLKRPNYTISGKVLNASSTPVAYAPVWAYQPTSSGHADTITDATGNYILYVDAGTWRIETDAPGVGWMRYSPDVAVAAASQSNINLRPTTGTVYYTVSGTVTIDGSTQGNMPFRAVKYNSSGVHQGQEFGGSTDSSGNYSLTLPEGIYRIDSWTPSYGEVELVYDQYADNPANINVSAATTTANITVAAADLQTVSLQFNNGQASQTGYLNIDEVDFSSGNPKPTGYHYSVNLSGLSATSTVKLKGSAAGRYYFFNLNIAGYGSYMPTQASRQALSNTYDCIKLTNAARSVYFGLPNSTTGTVTISGSVTAGGSPLTNAWVWLNNPSSNFFTGAESNNSGIFSLTVPKLSSGGYNIGADKPGYMSPAPSAISGTASSTGNTIALSAYTLTISGRVYTDSDSSGTYSTSTEALPNGWVWAKETTSGQMTQAPADATGVYSLGVVNGTWEVHAGADGYNENTYRSGNTKSNVTVAGTAMPNINIALSTNSSWSAKSKSKSITPASGGTIDDTAANSTGVKMIIPPNALGSDSSSGNISVQETNSVTETSSAQPLGNIGKVITATNNSGNAITNLNDYVDIELVYYKADIADMNIVDYSKLKNLTLSYWDSTSNNWVNLSTTRKAYYKTAANETEWTQKSDSSTQTGYEEFIDALVAGTSYYDYKLVLSGKTNHLTVFGATQPQDALFPASPAGLSQSSGGGTSVALSWTAVSTNSDSTAIADLLGYEVYRSADGSTYTQLNGSDVSGTTYTDSTSAAWNSYYYKITAADDGGNETSLSDATALRICSTKTVSHGTVAATCAITCDAGYTVSGNSCVAVGGGMILGGGNNNQPQQEKEEEIAKEIVKKTKEVITEVVDTAKQAANEFTQKVITIASEAAEVFKANINSLLEKFGFKRDVAKEQASAQKYVKELIKNAKGLTKENQYALTNFVAYGTDTTLKLGEGERAGVVNSYKSAFNKLPANEAEWSDVIKIANGRWPSAKNSLSEANAAEAFKKIYKRNPDRTNSHDDAAVTVIAYGLRPSNRNTDSEKAAIKSFKAIYGYNPSTATAWDVVRAIAYSGATR